VNSQTRPAWVVPATVTAMMLAAGVPTVISDYRDGRRFDFRGAARWLTEQIAPGDVVFSDQPMVLQHYLPQVKVLHLQQNPVPLADSLRRLQAGGRSTLWLVAPAASHAFRATLKESGLRQWIYGNCQPQNTLGRGRVDLRQHYLQVYRCPPARRNHSSGRPLGRALAFPPEHLAVDGLVPVDHPLDPIVLLHVVVAPRPHGPTLRLR
jgi:hypothetical protein